MFGILDHPLEEISVLQRTMGQKSKVSELSNTKLGATKVHRGEWERNYPESESEWAYAS